MKRVLKERWKAIPGFSDCEISTYGRVWSWKGYEGKIMKPGSIHGYQNIILRFGCKPFGFLVHRLVLETFVGPCPEGMECDHINTIRDDNKRKNLRWLDITKNRGEYSRGKISSARKLNDTQVKEIRNILKRKGNKSYREIGLNYKVTSETIRNLALLKTYKWVI